MYAHAHFHSFLDIIHSVVSSIHTHTHTHVGVVWSAGGGGKGRGIRGKGRKGLGTRWKGEGGRRECGETGEGAVSKGGARGVTRQEVRPSTRGGEGRWAMS